MDTSMRLVVLIILHIARLVIMNASMSRLENYLCIINKPEAVLMQNLVNSIHPADFYPCLANHNSTSLQLTTCTVNSSLVTT